MVRPADATAFTSIPRLSFAVEGVEAVEHAAAPTLSFAVRVTEQTGADVRSVVLGVQLRVAVGRRPYDAAQRARLAEVLAPAGGPQVGTLSWTQATVVVPAFSGSTLVEVPVPCTYDFDVAAAKYLHALGDGDVPLELLFSGTVFAMGERGLSATRVSWDGEADFGLPVRVWREALDHHFPGQNWLRIRRDVFDRLYAYRTKRALPTWEATLEALLEEEG